MAPEVAALCRRRRLPWSEIIALLGVATVGTWMAPEVAAQCRRRRLPWLPQILMRINEGVLATAAAVTACLDSWFCDSCSPHLSGR